MADSKLTREEINELRKLIHELDIEMDAIQFNKLLETGEAAKSFLKSLRYQAGELNRELGSLAGHISDTVKELRKSESGAFNITKSYREIDDIGRQILNHQKGYNQMSADDADLLVTKLKYEKKRLEDLQKQYKLEEEFLEKKKQENDDLEKKLEEEIKDLETKGKLNKEEEKLLKEKKGLLNEVVDKNSNIPELLIANKEAHEQINKLLGEENHKYKTLVDYAKQIRSEQENLERAIGVTGAALDSIGAGFEKIGLGSLADRIGLDKAKNKMKEFANYITDGGKKSAGLVTQFRILSVGINSLGKSILKNLTDPLIMAGLAMKGVQKGVGLVKLGFSSVLGFVKNLWGMADSFAAVFEKYAKAGQFAAQNFSAVGGQVNALTSGLNAAAAADPFMRVAEAGPALKAIVDGTGMMTTQMTKSVKEAHDLSYWLGYSAEETGKLYKLGGLNNQSAKETLIDIKARGVALNSQYKTSIDLRRVEQTALKASSAVTYNLRQNPKAIADAAFHAAKLNMTLDEIASAAEQTLNFESSIQDQLTYQAMSGKEINIDAYQQAALRGDTVTSARELNNLIAKHGPGLKNNVLLQEAFAKSVGIGKDKLLEAMTATDLARQMGEDRNDVEKQLQALQRKGLTLEEASNELAKEGLAGSLAKSKRAEAMSRALEDFRDYMATRLWPLFKAVFSPANIKMFMSVISGMRPVFVELGKAITAFFSPKSAGAMTDIIKNDVMPAILDMAKMLTEVAGVAGEALFGIIKSLGPIIKKDIIPIFKMLGGIIRDLAPTVGTLIKSFAGGLAKIFSKIGEHKEDIKSFIEILAKGLTNVFGFVADHLKEIAITLVAFKAVSAVRSLKSAILGSPGSSAMNPMYVKNVGVGGIGGGITGGGVGKGGAVAAAGGGIMSQIKGFLGMGGAASAAAEKSTSFADKRKMVLERQAAGGGLAGKAAARSAGDSVGAAGSVAGKAGAGAGAGVSGASKFGDIAGGMLKGAAALLVLSGALYVAAKAFQEFSDVDWEDFGKGVAALAVLGTTAYLLSRVKKDMLEGAIAIGILGAALIPAAKAFQMFNEVDPSSLLKAAGALTILGVAAGILAPLVETGVLLAGAAGIAVLGLSLLPLAAALNLAEPGLIALGDIFSKVLAGIPPIINAIADGLVRLATEANPLALIALGTGLSALAVGVGALGLAAASAGMAGAVSSFFGGGGLFTLLEQLIEISKINFKPAAISLKEGIIEIASIGAGVDLGPFENMFDDLEDAIEEIDIDDLKKFDELKNVNFKEAANHLKEGIASLAELGSSFNLGSDYGIFGDIKGALFGESDENGLQAVFKKLESVFDYLNSAIEEIDVTSFVEFSKLASVNITDAVASLQQGMASLAGLGESFNIGTDGGLFGDIGGALFGESDENSLQAVFKKLERVFDLFEDAIAEIDVKQLSDFSKITGSGIANAVESLQEGLQALVGLEIKGADDNALNLDSVKSTLKSLERVFDLFEDAIAELDFNQLTEFSKLASVSMTYAVKSLQEGMTALVGLKVTGSENAELSLEELKSVFKTLERVFDLFEDALAELDFQQLSNFSKLASVSLVGAVDSLQKGMSALTSLKLTTEGDDGGLVSLKDRFSQLEDVFEALDDAIGELSLDNIIKFAELAKAELVKAGQNVIDGITSLSQSTFNAKEVNLENITSSLETFNEAIGTIGFDKIKAFSDLANADLVKAAKTLILGVEELSKSSFNVVQVDLTNVKTSLETFNTAIGNIRFDKIKAFADLANGDLVLATEKISKAIIYLKDNIKTGTVAGLGEVETAFETFNDAVGTLKLDNIKILGEIGSTQLENSGQKLKDGFDNFKNAFSNVKAADYEFLLKEVKPVFTTITQVFDQSVITMLDSLKKFAEGDYSKFSKAVLDFNAGLAEFKKLSGEGGIDDTTLTALQTLFTRLNQIFNPEGGGINLDNILKFGGANFSEFKKSMIGFKEGLIEFKALANELVTVDAATGAQSFDVSKIQTLLTNLSAAFAGENIGKLVEFGKNADFSKLPTTVGQLKTAIDTLNKIDYSNDFSTLSTFFANVINGIVSVASGQNAINTFVSLDFPKLASSIASFKSVVETLGSLSVPAELGQTMVNIKTAFDALSGMEVLKTFSEINGDAVYQVSEKIALSIEKLSAIKLSKDTLETTLSSFSNALDQLDIEVLNGLAAINVTNLPNVATSIQEFITKAQSINISDDIFKNIETQLGKFSDVLSELDVESLGELAKVNGANLTTVSISIKDVIANWNSLSVSEDLADKLDLFNEAISQLDIEDLNEFTTLNGASLLTASTSIKDAINAWIGLTVSENLPTNLENFNDGISELDIENLKLLNDLNTSNLQTNFANLKTSIEQFKDMANIAPAIKLISTFHKVLDVFFKADYSKSTVVSTIQELTKIDTTKLDTLKTSIDNLSISFKGFGETIKGIGDLNPIVTITTQMLKMQETISKNPIKNPEKLAENVGAIFSGLMGSLVSFVEGGGEGVSNSFLKGATAPKFAEGGIITKRIDNATIGEAGPEAVIPLESPIGKEILNVNPKSTSSTNTTVEYSALLEEFREFRKMMASNKDQPIVINTQLNLDGEVVAKNTEEKLRTRRQRI